MATVDADTLLVRVAADVSSLQGELKKATDAMAKAMAAQAKETKQLNDALGRVGRTIKDSIVGAISALSLGKLGQLGREALKLSEDLEQTSKWLGVGVEKLQAWEYGARQAGLEQGKLTQALDKMRGNLADFAADPSSNGAQLFRQLGISLRDGVTGQLRTLEAIVPQLASKLKTLGPGDQLVVGKMLFGDKNDDVVRFLLQDLKAVEAAAAAAGIVWKREFIEPNAQLHRDIELLENKIGKDLKKAVVDFAPAWKFALEAVVEVQLAVNKLLSSIRIGGARVGQEVSATERLGELDRDIAAAERRAATAVPRRPGTFGIGTSRGAEEAAKLQQDLARMRGERAAILDRVDAEAAARQAPASSVEQDALLAGITPTGKRGDRLKFGGEDEFAKKIREMTREARALSDQLAFDKPAADFRRLVDEFAAGNGKIAPTRAQVEAFAEALRLKQSREGLVALKDMREEEIALAQSSMLEASGQREAAEALRLKFELQKKYGPAFAASQEEWIRQMARYKVASADAAEQMRGSMQELQGFVQIGASSMTDAIQAFSDKSKSAMEELRRIGANVLQQLANMALRLALLNPLQNWINGDNRLPTIGSVINAASGVLSRLGGGGVDASGISLPGRATGGPISANVPYLVGEHGPEIVTSSRSAYVNPNRALGGSTYYIDARGADQAGLARLEAMIRQVNGSVEHRSVAAVFNARARGGKFARAF